MVSKEDALRIIDMLKAGSPAAFFQQVDKTESGIFCVLQYAAESEKPVSAGEISRHMHVSTARVAVLLRKMESRGLICRTPSPDDARKVLVTVTASGAETVRQLRENMLTFACAVFDRMGLDRMEQFAALALEMKQAAEAVMQEGGIHCNGKDLSESDET